MGDEVVRNLDALVGRPQHEITRMKDVLAVGTHVSFFDVLLDFLLAIGVDTGNVRVLEFEKRLAQSQVDAGRLNL